jgi:hypothetical protein
LYPNNTILDGFGGYVFHRVELEEKVSNINVQKLNDKYPLGKEFYLLLQRMFAIVRREYELISIKQIINTDRFHNATILYLQELHRESIQFLEEPLD